MEVSITSWFGWVIAFLFFLECVLSVVKIHLMKAAAKQRTNNSIKQAMTVLSESLQHEPDYAFSWYHNLYMSIYESMETGTHELKLEESQRAARTFMNLAFHIEIPLEETCDSP